MERKENVISSLKDGLDRRVSNHIRPVKLVNAIFYDFINEGVDEDYDNVSMGHGDRFW
jgi:hypothetical protein